MRRRSKRSRPPQSWGWKARLVTIRLSPRLVRVLEGSAAVFELPLEVYILRVLRRQADDLERENPPLKLSPRGLKWFMRICNEPPRPNAALRKAVKLYKARCRNSGSTK